MTKTLDDDVIACAGIVERGDPLRFRTVMSAPVELRARLFPLYAFNVEVSRAPWVTQEPMIAEMRLQWWRDALEEIKVGGDARRHEVVTPLARVLSPTDADALDQCVAARVWDCYRDPFEDEAHLHRYIDQTSGVLMEVAARLTGYSNPQIARAAGFGAGAAAFFRAVPALEQAGRIPLIEGTHAGLKAFAGYAVSRMPKKIPGGPATWPAIGARNILQQVQTDPSAVAEGRLEDGLTRWRFARALVLGRI